MLINLRKKAKFGNHPVLEQAIQEKSEFLFHGTKTRLNDRVYGVLQVDNSERSKRFTEADLDGAWYVLAATDDPAVNARVAAEAEARRIFCVRADHADGGTAWTPATGEIEGATVAVLTDHDPRRAKALRDRLLASLIG